LHPSSNTRLHLRYLLQPITNAGLYPSSNTGLYPRCHRSPWFKKVEGVQSSLMLEMPFMEPTTCIRALCRTASEVVHYLGYGLIFCEYIFLDWCNLFSAEIYNQ
jgi:hypothetical protein